MEGAQVVIAGERGADDTRALFDAAIRAPGRGRGSVTVVGARNGAACNPTPPTARAGSKARAAAYVCVGQTCSLPETDADGLRAAMARG